MNEGVTPDPVGIARRASDQPWTLAELQRRIARCRVGGGIPNGRSLSDFLTEDTPSGLLVTEERLLRASEFGQLCNASLPSENTDRRVRAGFLRFLALGGDCAAPVHEQGVQLTGAVLDGSIDLSGAKCVGRLMLGECEIHGALQIEDATLGVLFLEGSSLRGIKGNRAQISGSVFLKAVAIVGGAIELFGAKIGGSLLGPDATIQAAPERDAVVCSAATIGGDVRLNGKFSAVGRVCLNGAEIRGLVNLEDARFSNPGGLALYLNGISVAASLQLSRATVRGGTSLTRADIKASLQFSGADLASDAGAALEGTSARIGGDLCLNAGLKVCGKVVLDASTIGGDLDCSRAQFTKGDDAVLSANGARIAAYARFNDSTFEGQVGLATAVVGADLAFWGSRVAVESGIAIYADACSIGGGAYLCSGLDESGGSTRPFTVQGEVTFSRAQIGRDFACGGGKFTNPTGRAFVLFGANVKGDLYLGQSYDTTRNLAGAYFEAYGQVLLDGATIGGHLDCTGGQFQVGEQGLPLAISCEIINVAGCIFLRAPDPDLLKQIPDLKSFRCDGEIRMVGALIGKQVNCVGGFFRNLAPNKTQPDSAGYALDLGLAKIDYGLLLGSVEKTDQAPATIHGSVFLSNVTTGEYADRGFVKDDGVDTNFFPATLQDRLGNTRSCDLFLDQFTYASLNGNSSPTYRARRSWLERQPQEHLRTSMRHQPFDHLAEVLRGGGFSSAARNVAILKQRFLTRSRRDLSLLWRPLFDGFMSYGYRPGLGLLWALLIAFATAAFYDEAAEHKAILPKEAGTPFHSLIYSMDVMLPVVKVGEADAWKVQPQAFKLDLPLGLGHVQIGADWTKYVIVAETLFGWVAGGLLVAIAGGFVKKS